MTEEYNFKNLCELTTRIMGLPDGSLALKSRKRPLQVARSVAGYIGITEADIKREVIAKVLNRDRSLIYHYERKHKKKYKTCSIYRDAFNRIYKAYLDIHGTKDIFLDGSVMKNFLLRNGVKERLKADVLLEVKSGQVKCTIKTSYFDFSNQIENINLALKNYHFSMNII
jgi:hypothetical protein